jgi:hypothetical protein
MSHKNEYKYEVEGSLQRHLTSVNELLDLMGADSIANAKQKWGKQLSSKSKLQDKIQLRENELKELTNTNNYANAKQRIRKLMKKEVTIAERFNLNIAFLDEPGKTWSFQVTGKTREEQFKSYTQREQAARAMTRQAYETALQRVVSYCEAEKMKEGTIRKEVLDIHTRMADDYNQLNQEAFWYEYCGQYTVSTGETAEPVPLVTWLDVCGEYFPERLIEDLRVREDDLGVISRALHEAWDGEVINDMKGVAFRVIKTAIEAAVWGSQGADMRTDAVLHNVLMNNGEPLDESTSLDSIVQLIEG